MHDWNVIATVHGDGFREGRKILEGLGRVAPSEFFNVLVMRVDDPGAFLEDLGRRIEEEPGVMNFVSRVVPAQHVFDFRSAEEFEAKAREIALAWAPRLAGKRFHVRMHRRGFKGRMTSPAEERFLDEALLAALEEAGTPGKITFDDPDAVVSIETVGNRAGMSLWTREELRRYPFLHVD